MKFMCRLGGTAGIAGKAADRAAKKPDPVTTISRIADLRRPARSFRARRGQAIKGRSLRVAVHGYWQAQRQHG
jgi:hypothetical protein